MTECHDPHERNKVQAFNDFLVFGSMAIGSFSSGALLAGYGWTAVNDMVFPVILAAAVHARLGLAGAAPDAGMIIAARTSWTGSRERTAHGQDNAQDKRKAQKRPRGRPPNHRTPSRRRAQGPASKRKAKPKPTPRKQTFVASHHSPDAFEQGLRRYAQYRDLGIAAATGGLARAHVIKMIPPCIPPRCRSGIITTSNFR